MNEEKGQLILLRNKAWRKFNQEDSLWPIDSADQLDVTVNQSAFAVKL